MIFGLPAKNTAFGIVVVQLGAASDSNINQARVDFPGAEHPQKWGGEIDPPPGPGLGRQG